MLKIKAPILKMKTPIIIILGGMGPMAGVELHKKIILNTGVKLDQDHYNIIHLSFSKFLTGKCLLNPPSRSNSMMGSVKTPHWTAPELARIMAASQPPY